MNERPQVLEVRGITKRFGPVRALHDVGFRLNAGEVVGLVGDNGAGKSTLVSVLSGLVKPDAGEVHVDGVGRSFDGPAQARAVGIETVYQQLALIPTLDIAENVYLGREPVRGGVGRVLRWMDKREMRRRVETRFAELGLPVPSVRTHVSNLSGGQRQAVAIGRAVLWGSHIVLLDEPTAALGVRQTEVVLAFIRQLRDRGVALIVISHDIPEVLEVADRVIALRLGEKVGDADADDVSGEELIAVMGGTRVLERQPADDGLSVGRERHGR